MRPLRTRPDPGSRRRDAGFFLPVAGVLLLLPPFINLFTHPRLIWGIPLEVVYLFGVWLALILGAFALSRVVPAASDAPVPKAPRPTGRTPD